MYRNKVATWYGGDDRTQKIWEESTQIVERFMETIDASEAIDDEIENGEHKEGWTAADALTNVEVTATKIEVSKETGEVHVHNAEVHGNGWTAIFEDDPLVLPVE
ncbi:hypothetical protein L202_05772 [Cryptococcus amylolentus CBS 6039]|uniref:Uncharacterized protein n=2 Tax=Cryptococcus amylolentus TaxID=104669 RepID=A0A1E3HJY7_9TREE|nr:hypothetical protein L202_05772 [Cryptococcus amylolentus CBS 6039]ODN75761.1 hypothetical protein L202_05772 [Cryptococcus amylolentus CBS 6039]ODN96933.1 hypothetical protein I350_07908 [Cryptococcus amylolentus CBS 6273]